MTRKPLPPRDFLIKAGPLIWGPEWYPSAARELGKSKRVISHWVGGKGAYPSQNTPDDIRKLLTPAARKAIRDTERRLAQLRVMFGGDAPGEDDLGGDD